MRHPRLIPTENPLEGICVSSKYINLPFHRKSLLSVGLFLFQGELFPSREKWKWPFTLVLKRAARIPAPNRAGQAAESSEPRLRQEESTVPVDVPEVGFGNIVPGEQPNTGDFELCVSRLCTNTAR